MENYLSLFKGHPLFLKKSHSIVSSDFTTACLMISFIFEQAYSVPNCVRQGAISALSFQCDSGCVFLFFI